MRSLFLLSLLATAALPALASAGGPDDSQRPRHARSSEASEAPDRGSGRERPSRGSSSGEERQAQREARREARGIASGGGEQPSRPAWTRGRGGMSDPAPTSAGTQDVDRREARRARRDSDGAESPAVQRGGDDGFAERSREFKRRRGLPDGSTVTAGTGRVPSGTVSTRHRDRDRDWSSNWRKDRRYDWSRYRDRNRSLFRLGFYFDPYGYRYRRHSIGWSMWPSYYQSSQWLNDPWMYRLPPTYGPYRWVRYWDDALLVNIYTGEVVDVIYSFFW